MKHMMQPVESSSIEAVGHDPDRNILTVRFRNGATYRYDGVSRDQHAALIGAKSIGAHFSTHIRNQFSPTKLLKGRTMDEPQISVPDDHIDLNRWCLEMAMRWAGPSLGRETELLRCANKIREWVQTRGKPVTDHGKNVS